MSSRQEEMNRQVKILVVLAFIVILTLSAGCAKTVGEKWVKVERVVDGDTFRIVEGRERVRMIGIDAPESVKPGEEPEPYGKEAAEFTRKVLSGQKVKLVFDVQERDKYGRLLAYVYLKDGTFVNALLVKEGYARVLTVPPNVAHAEKFVRLEREARLHKKGLWGID